MSLNVDKLTQRELEVVLLLTSGYSTVEISTELAISVRTVEMHIANARSKYFCRNKVELVNAFFQKRLMEC